MTFTRRIVQLPQRLADDTSGATMTEYAVIIGLLSVVIGFVMPEIMASVDGLFARTISGLRTALLEINAPVIP